VSYLGYNPIFGSPMARDMTAAEFRAAAPGSPWRYDPWTGHQRLEDIDLDPCGHSIEAPDDGGAAARWRDEMQAMADAVPLGMQSLNEGMVDQLVIGLAQQLDGLIRQGLGRHLGAGWTLASIQGEVSASHYPGGKTFFKLNDVPFLIVRGTKILPSKRGCEVHLGIDYAFI
jgi:hypothetical protein